MCSIAVGQGTCKRLQAVLQRTRSLRPGSDPAALADSDARTIRLERNGQRQIHERVKAVGFILATEALDSALQQPDE